MLSVLDIEAIAKSMADEDMCLTHLGIFAESKINSYGIFGSELDQYMYGSELRDVLLQKGGDGIYETYEEFEEVNNEWIKKLGVRMPEPLQGPPERG